MKKKSIIVLFSILIFSITTFSQDLEEVLQNVNETIGMDKLSKVQTLKMTGTAFQFGMETPFTTIITRDGKLYLEVPIQGQLMKQGFDGENGWMIAPWTGSSDPVDLPDVQIKSLKTQADIDGMLYDYEKKGYKTELTGTEDLEGAEVYVIRQETKDGDVYTHFIDGDNFVLIKTTMTIQYQGSELVIDTYMSDYKLVEGILLSHSTEIMVDDQVQRKITVKEVFMNEEVDESIFQKPEVAAKEPAEGE